MIDVHGLPVMRVLLVGLPLMAVGGLAIRTVEADHALLRTRQAEAAALGLRAVADTAQATVERLAEAEMQQVSRAAESIQTLRALVSGGEVAWAAVHKAGRRIFPPEDSGYQLFQEGRKLQAVAGPLEAARADLWVGAPSPQRRAWKWVPSKNGAGLLQCRPGVDEGSDVCVLTDGSALRAAVRTALGDALSRPGGWSLALRDESGATLWRQDEGAADAAADMDMALRDSLGGWRAEVRFAPSALERNRRWLPVAAIALPLILCWAALAWQAHWRQEERLRGSRRNLEIIGQLSHELRTPLANLCLYTELMRRKAEEPAAIRDYCAVAEEEIGRLTRLAEDAIAFAKGLAPQERLLRNLVPVEAAQAVVARLTPLLERAGCRVTVNGDRDRGCRADGGAFDSVLMHLLDNARKYAPGAAIEVTARVEPERLSLIVRDHGPGIARDLRDRLFEPLVRGRAADVGGFGLGLATVRRLARANGGDVRVEEGTPGARFVVWFRIAPLAGGNGEGPCVS